MASFNLGWTRAAKWLIDTVDVKGAGTYRIDMHVAWKGPGGTFRLEFNGVDRIGPINVPDTGGKSASSGDIDYLKFVKH